MDYRTALYKPVYATLGVPAVLTPPGGEAVSLTAIDKTAGVELAGPVDVQTVVPAAIILAGDLADLGGDPDRLDGGQIALNGKAWRIASHRPQPSPGGAADGEIYLLLEET